MTLKDLPPNARPQERLLTLGPAALSDAELVALILRTGTAGRSVVEMSWDLLQKFGGIAGLLGARIEELSRAKGLGGRGAKCAQLSAVLELARRALDQRLKEREVFGSPEAVRRYLQLELAALPHEAFAVMFLDVQNRLLAMEQLFRGSLSHASVYPREVVVRALNHGAASVVLAHNHPSGDVDPSQADISITRQVKAALALVDVRVLDHVVVAPGKSMSMAEAGLV